MTSSAWSERANRVIPGGHHLSGRPLLSTEGPMYFDAAHGAYVRGVDGREYVDWLMAYGPFLLGYGRAEVDAAAAEQGKRARLVSLNHPLHVEFIEQLLPLFPGAEMGMFMRTGSEATTAALRIARRATGRRRIARCGYHGWHDWCLPLESFVPDGLAAQVLEFSANEPATLEAVFDSHPGEIAAVILAPEMMLPLDGSKLRSLAGLARAAGAVFIMDEVKTGLRTLSGSVCARFGVIPDLITLSKAIGNGWPIAAVLGSRAVMEHAAGLHVSATFHGDLSAMAAALKTLEIAHEECAAEYVDTIGRALIDGLRDIGSRYNVTVDAYPEPIPAMPFMRLSHPDEALSSSLREVFYSQMLTHGILLHPRHLWFPSTAHSAVELERTLRAADSAMRYAAEHAFDPR